MSKGLKELIEFSATTNGERYVMNKLAAQILKVAEEWCDEVYTEDSNGLFRGLKKEKLTADEVDDLISSEIESLVANSIRSFINDIKDEPKLLFIVKKELERAIESLQQQTECREK